MGKDCFTFVAVSLSCYKEEVVTAFREKVAAMSEVLECYHIAGDEDYLLKVLAQDMPAYEHFLLHRLATIEGVGKVRTRFIMSTVRWVVLPNSSTIRCPASQVRFPKSSSVASLISLAFRCMC